MGWESSGLLSNFAAAAFVGRVRLAGTEDSGLALAAGAAAGADGGRAPVRR